MRQAKFPLQINLSNFVSFKINYYEKFKRYEEEISYERKSDSEWKQAYWQVFHYILNLVNINLILKFTQIRSKLFELWDMKISEGTVLYQKTNIFGGVLLH